MEPAHEAVSVLPIGPSQLHDDAAASFEGQNDAVLHALNARDEAWLRR